VCGDGVCESRGERSCQNGRVVDSCQPGVAGIEADECNEQDEDCDGKVDEGCVPDGVPCAEAGQCLNGGWCEPAGRPDCWAGDGPVCFEAGHRTSILYCGRAERE
jgi:hypothetical protein